jgi:hypothetical protein
VLHGQFLQAIVRTQTALLVYILTLVSNE